MGRCNRLLLALLALALCFRNRVDDGRREGPGGTFLTDSQNRTVIMAMYHVTISGVRDSSKGEADEDRSKRLRPDWQYADAPPKSGDEWAEGKHPGQVRIYESHRQHKRSHGKGDA